MTGDCFNCGHPIGYHHLDDEMHCSVNNCRCPGYRDDMIAGPDIQGKEKDPSE